MRFAAWDHKGELLLENDFYSVGGGFVVDETETGKPPQPPGVPYPFSNAAELIDWTDQSGGVEESSTYHGT